MLCPFICCAKLCDCNYAINCGSPGVIVLSPDLSEIPASEMHFYTLCLTSSVRNFCAVHSSTTKLFSSLDTSTECQSRCSPLFRNVVIEPLTWTLLRVLFLFRPSLSVEYIHYMRVS